MLTDWPCPLPAGGTSNEYAVAFESGAKHRILVLPALFDEANKTRHQTIEIMRRFDGAGVDSVLPDLAGMNESVQPLAEQTLESWQAAARAAAAHFQSTHVLTIRAGALLAPSGLPGWRYAPSGGKQAIRSMIRARTIASREAGTNEKSDDLMQLGDAEGIELAGYQVGSAMFRQLAAAATPDAGNLTDIAQSDLGAGGGLWLRAEPDYRRCTGRCAGGDHHHEPAEMTRRHFSFDCGAIRLVGTLDEAAGPTGMLLITGGNETRAGAFSGQSALAAQIGAAGFPVMRFDRRGVGDSQGINFGFTDEGPDIAAAVSAFREQASHVTRIIGYGNCDAASALMLNKGAGLDGLILTNPWTIEEAGAAPPPDAVRARYAEKLKNPSELLRLFSGGVSLRKLASGVMQAMRLAPPPSSLAQEMRAGIEGFEGPITFLLAGRDRTAELSRLHGTEMMSGSSAAPMPLTPSPRTNRKSG